MASPGPLTGRGTITSVIYRAEAYRDTDGSRETVWGCAHQHRSIEGAVHCANSWMGAHEAKAV